ncbi:MAG TPA: hypothetical protein VG755_05845, partial [Nannocystaceae bacterium]|nr:hypothetical protein [Nannocystaceae bacterium]
CSSLGGIELGDDGPDRFPEDDDGYGPSSATSDPTRGSEPADDTSGGSSETSSAPEPDSIGHEATGGGGSESSSDGGDTSDGEDPQGTTGDAESSTSGSDTSSDGVGSNDPCAGMRLPACPPACELDGESPCGMACDLEVDEGYTCGDEYGAGMTCRAGVWVCFDPPLYPGECTMVCDPSASP